MFVPRGNPYECLITIGATSAPAPAKSPAKPEKTSVWERPLWQILDESTDEDEEPTPQPGEPKKENLASPTLEEDPFRIRD